MTNFFYHLGWAIGEALSEPSTFDAGALDFKANKAKKCDRGYKCGMGCISTKKSCRMAVSGEAKNFAQYVKQNKGRLTKAQKAKAKEQNIGLKADIIRKREKRNILPKGKNNQKSNSISDPVAKRAEIIKQLGDLENTVIPKAIARQAQAKLQLKDAQNELTRSEAKLKRYGDFIGPQNRLSEDQAISKAKANIKSAIKEDEEASDILAKAQSKKAELENELRSLPFPKVTPISIERLNKPLTEDEINLVAHVSGNSIERNLGKTISTYSSEERIPKELKQLNELANRFGGLDSIRQDFRVYQGMPRASIIRFVDEASKKAYGKTDMDIVLSYYYGIEVIKNKKQEQEFRQKFQREIEMIRPMKKAKELGMDDHEAAAIISYTTNGYVGMNGYMRGLSLNPNSPTAKYQDLMARSAYQAAKKLPNYQGEVKRGSREPESRIREFEEAMKTGKTVSFDGFTSTSATKNKDIEGGYGKSAKEQAMSGKGLEKASEWQELNNRANLLQWNPGELKGVEYKINVKSGKKIADISSQPKEDEVLVLPDAKFKVKAVSYDGDKAIIELDEE